MPPQQPAQGPPPVPMPQSSPDYGYGRRWDEATQGYNGPNKGLGYFGPLTAADGGTIGEYSADDDIDGRNVSFPTIVPTLTQEELQATLAAANVGGPVPASVMAKARAFAQQRIAQGKSPFAEPGEQDLTTYPDLARNPIPTPLPPPLPSRQSWPPGSLLNLLPALSTPTGAAALGALSHATTTDNTSGPPPVPGPFSRIQFGNPGGGGS